MFLAETLTAVHKTLTEIFNDDYPVEAARNIRVSIEYPEDAQDYPGIWIDLAIQGDLERSGINYSELVENPDGSFGEIDRWSFDAEVSLTVLAMSSLARARLLDEVVRVVGMQIESGRKGFSKKIMENKMIGLTPSTDRLRVSGMATVPGTPWGTDEMVYEVTVNFGLMGEFCSTPEGSLVPLSEIRIDVTQEPEPTSP